MECSAHRSTRDCEGPKVQFWREVPDEPKLDIDNSTESQKTKPAKLNELTPVRESEE